MCIDYITELLRLSAGFPDASNAELTPLHCWEASGKRLCRKSREVWESGPAGAYGDSANAAVGVEAFTAVC